MAASDRVLGGADTFALTIDAWSRARGGRGFVCQAVVALDGHLDPQLLETSLARVREQFPELACEVRRRWPLGLPTWRSHGGEHGGVTFDVHDAEEAWSETGPTQDLLEAQLRQGLRVRGGDPLLRYRLVHLPDGGSLLAIAFQHVLTDATGLERLLGWQAALQPAPPVRVPPPDPGPGGVQELQDRGLSAQRFLPLVDTFRAHPPKELQPAGPLGEVRTWRLTLDDLQSQAVSAAMRADGAAMNPSGWLLGHCVQLLHGLAEDRGCPPQGYLVPVAMGLRRKGDHRPDLANRMGFLFVHLRADELASVAGMAKRVRRQTMEQLGSDIPSTMADAMYFARRLPPAWVGRAMNTAIKGSFASFYFGYTGEVTPALDTFLGHRVQNLLHFPTLPAPPGLACIFNRFQGRLNACLSWQDGMLSDPELARLQDGLRERLGVA